MCYQLAEDTDRGALLYAGGSMKPNGMPTHKRSMKLLSSLKAAPYNPRRISDRALDGLAASIEKFGLVQEIIINKRTGHVVGGHQRLKVLEASGVKSVPVVEVDLDEREEQALNIALNSTLIAGEFTPDLDPLLKQIEADLPKLFDDLMLKDLRKLIVQEPKEGKTDADDVPEPPKIAVTKPGDLWELGDHRLFCGDATQSDEVGILDIDEQMETVTDPPYGIGYDYSTHDDKDSTLNDKLVRAAFAHAPRTKVWTPGLMNLSRELQHYPDAKCLVWHKGFAQAGNGLGGASTWEPVLCVDVTRGRLPNDYLHFGTDREPELRSKHPCPKPVSLFVHLIEHLTRHVVYDPFLGSGTTLIAAEQLDRRCFGLEIDPLYCDVIVERWENFTGGKAKRKSV